MNASRTILVTGATGKLGGAVCRCLRERGHDVRATDVRFVRDFPLRIELGDLKDELFVYRVTEGCDAIVHLGNHPNSFAGPSAPRILAENVAMNANVFHAAMDYGVHTVVFASSVQVMIRRDAHAQQAGTAIAYLPLDGDMPANPGPNTYAQSKEFAERMLRIAVDLNPELSATAIRFPMLVNEWLAHRLTSPGHVPLDRIDFAECTSHLFFTDAAALCADVVEKRLPGYHQYFPAQTMDLRGYPLADVIRDRYGAVPLRRPLLDLASLVDLSALARELGWAPRERLSISVDR